MVLKHLEARAARLTRLSSRFYVCPRCQFSISRLLRSDSASPQAPLLSTLRNDLKTAMKTKNATQLSVLRALLAEVTNASKTSSPITSDIALLALFKKRIAAGRNAVQEFKDANRKDLVEKEEGQLAILEQYAGSVDVVGEKEITRAVYEALESMKSAGEKADMGSLMRKVTGPGAPLDGKPVEKKDVASKVKEALAAQS